MDAKTEMTKKRKGVIAITAGICVIAMLLAVIAVHSVMSTSAIDKPERETERINADIVEQSVEPALQTGQQTQVEQQTQPEQQAQTEPQTQAPQQTEAAPVTTAEGNIQVENNSIITSERAKEIALSDAGLKESQVTMSKVKYEWDDGIQIYDVEFYSGGLEYEYEIDARNGMILEKDIDD